MNATEDMFGNNTKLSRTGRLLAISLELLEYFPGQVEFGNLDVAVLVFSNISILKVLLMHVLITLTDFLQNLFPVAN